MLRNPGNFVYLPDARRYVNLLYVVELALPPVNAAAWGQGHLRLAGEEKTAQLSVGDAQVLAHALYYRAANGHDTVPLNEFHPDYRPPGRDWA